MAAPGTPQTSGLTNLGRVGSVGTRRGRGPDREGRLVWSRWYRGRRPGSGADGGARPRHCRFAKITLDTALCRTRPAYARAAPARSDVRSAAE